MAIMKVVTLAHLDMESGQFSEFDHEEIADDGEEDNEEMED
jgi:hypothetical protein